MRRKCNALATGKAARGSVQFQNGRKHAYRSQVNGAKALSRVDRSDMRA
jgi:hypothetical protein